MLNNKWWMLQLFAGEGAGGSGAASGGDGASAASGENTADAGQQRLRELGVPEDKIRKNRAYRAPAAQAQAKPAETEGKGPEQAAAAEETAPTEEKAPRMTWDEIMKDPEYNKSMQGLIQSRLRQSKASQEAMEKLGPALEMLMQKHGMDPAKPDYDGLAKKLMDDDSLYEQKAFELDVPNDVAKTIVQQDMKLKRFERQEKLTLEAQKTQQHFQRLEQQAAPLKAQFPGFDLRTELQNPVFERMTRPDSGLTVEDAYFAVHRKDIQQAQAQVIASQTAQAVSNAVRSNSRRPDESGASGQAPSVATFDYRKASKEERNALKNRIRSAAARGEKVYPGR